MILKYGDFITEAKAKDKGAIVDLLIKLLEEKPKVTLSGKTFPDEKDAYTLAGIKKYFRDHGFTSEDVDDAFYYLGQDKDKKSKVKHFNAKNFHYDENYPYHYIGLTQAEVDKVKERIEKESQEMAKPEIEKRQAAKKKHVAAAKEREAKKADKKTTERKTPAKKTTTRTKK